MKGAEILEGETDLAWLAGEGGNALRAIEEASAVRVSARGNKVHLEGAAADVERVRAFLRELARLRERGLPCSPSTSGTPARAFFRDGEDLAAIFQEVVLIAPNKRPVSPKSPTQLRYVQAIRANDLVLGIGPAGTGKTFLAMAMGVALLSQKRVSRIILTRPAVEAGERLGFLPGDLYDKIHPYLRPLYDALYHMVDPDRVAKLVERGTIEVAPLAYMRGRTLNDSFVILDEAQNSTTEQMKMFLTRLGFDSKAVITGDVTQIDLPVRAGLRADRGGPGAAGGAGRRDGPLHRARRGAPRARPEDHPRLRAACRAGRRRRAPRGPGGGGEAG